MAQRTTDAAGGARARAVRSRSVMEPRPEVSVPVVGSVIVPPPDRLVYYVALGVLTALEIIEWPIALVIGVGHFLAEQHVSHALQEVGKAVEAV
ncbi:hypothetical protein [Sphaerisporangium corydalis]|uniref:Uncharacterized protein n=1 Tax=Sphaerisporangium corydalis TaxID=1441875 RepID=A0ABV9EMT0_9ACTN|nr:hypothetical protein [Sphaerisporangium corydalis]